MEHKPFILILDHKIESGRILKNILSNDFNPVYIKDEIEAINFIKKNGIDIVISDFYENITEEFINKITEIDSSISIIILSGTFNYELIIKLMNTGNVFRFLGKPVDYDDLKLSILKGYEATKLKRDKENLISELERNNYILNEQTKILIKNYSELKTLHEELIKREKLSTIGEFTASIAHDLKNELGIIRGYSELILLKAPEFKEYVEKVIETIDDLTISLQDLLNYVKGRHTDYRYEIIGYEKFFKDTKEYLEKFFSNYSRRINFNIKEIGNDRNLKIKIDRTRIKRVLINIVKNAIEATLDRPSPEVNVIFSTENKYLKIIVEDNGIGIKKEDLENIFKMFFTAGKKTGTGLGLAISKNIIENHNGKIEVDSQLNIGTTFTIYLPEFKNKI